MVLLYSIINRDEHLHSHSLRMAKEPFLELCQSLPFKASFYPEGVQQWVSSLRIFVPARWRWPLFCDPDSGMAYGPAHAGEITI